jgi:hypothetical protein
LDGDHFKFTTFTTTFATTITIVDTKRSKSYTIVDRGSGPQPSFEMFKPLKL